MDNLIKNLAKLKEKLEKYRDTYENNEMAVRNHIINPILTYLGWDIENPEEVIPNEFGPEGIPDYILLKNKKKILLIEAKKLKVDIEKVDYILQLGKYCFGVGAKYGMLTNGAKWLLIKSFEIDIELPDRKILSIDLYNDKLETLSRKFNYISKANIENADILIKKYKTLDNIWKSIKTKKDWISILIPFFKNKISLYYNEYSFSDAEIEAFLKENINNIFNPPNDEPHHPPTLPIPKRIRIGGEEFTINYAYEILINTANWLIKQGKLKISDAPIEGSAIRYLISKTPRHKNGREFFLPKRLTNGLYIETNYSARYCIEFANRLLEKFYPSMELILKYE